MSPRSPLAAAAVALALVAAACGGDDDAAVSTTVEIDDPTADAGAPAASGAPAATLEPGLPEEIVAEIGPVEVQGNALPPLGEADPASDPAVGSQAPVLVGVDYAGNTVRVDPAVDGPTMVVFLAHWCPHCNREVPKLNQLRDEGAFPEGLNVVAVSTAADPSRPNFPPSQWVEEMDWTYPVIADGIDTDLESLFIGATAYGVDGFPFTALVDADGTVVARWSGEREPDQILDAIGRYLAVG